MRKDFFLFIIFIAEKTISLLFIICIILIFFSSFSPLVVVVSYGSLILHWEIWRNTKKLCENFREFFNLPAVGGRKRAKQLSLSLARQSEVEILCEKWQENCKIYVNFRCTTGNFQLSTNFAGFSLHLMRVLLLWDGIENREIGEHFFFVSCLHYAKQFPLEDTHRGCDRGKKTHRK